MPQRALLFSSDPETSRRLAQALRELEFSVDHCPEIFAAVERITSHSFEVVVADWDDGVEAMFLIKTARELSLNCDAFRIVAAKPETATAAQKAGAQMVLPKPALPGHTKYALLTSDDFVRRMKIWAPALAMAPRISTQPVQAAPEQHEAPPLPQAAVAKTWRQQPAVIDEDGGMTLSFSSLESGSNFFPHLGNHLDFVETLVKPRLRLFLWVALTATGLSTGYFFSAAFKAQAASESVSSAMHSTLSAGAATAPASPFRKESKLTIRVTPRPEAYPERASVEVPATITEPLEDTAAEPQVSLRPSIPASLSVPLEPELGARSSSPKPTAALMSGIEPVNLTEELAEKSLLQRVMPDYPMKALQSKLQGAVQLQAWIRKDGTVRDLKVMNGPLVLCQAAYSAVKQWRYKPFQMNGQAVEATTYVTVNFQLP